MRIEFIRKLWNHVPILSVDKIGALTGMGYELLEEFIVKSGISSVDEFRYREKFVSYSLDGTHQKRCKYCSIILLDKTNDFYHKNNGGFCSDCLDRYDAIQYNKKISWYKNMLGENWMPTNKGWQNEETGIFLPKNYQYFFQENFITP